MITYMAIAFIQVGMYKFECTNIKMCIYYTYMYMYI